MAWESSRASSRPCTSRLPIWRRPGAAEVATNPLEAIPKGVLSAAEQLLQEGGAAVAKRLGTPVARMALERQAVEAGTLVAAVGPRGRAPHSPGDKKVIGSRDHIQQVLAQVLWEEELIKEQASAEASQRAMSKGSTPPLTLDSFGRTQMTMTPPRVPKTPHPISRPATARETRIHIIKQDQEDLRHQWENKEAHLRQANELRRARLHQMRERANGENVKLAHHVATWKENEYRQQTQRAAEILETEDQKESKALARFKADRGRFTRKRVQSARTKSTMAEMNRMDVTESDKEHVASEVAAASSRRAHAEVLRQKHLQQRALGRVQLREARELAHWQHERLLRLQEHEREELRSRLDEPTVFTHDKRYD